MTLSHYSEYHISQNGFVQFTKKIKFWIGVQFDCQTAKETDTDRQTDRLIYCQRL
jgi:hypothetical protein